MALLCHNVVLLRSNHADYECSTSRNAYDYMHNWLHHQNGAHGLSVAHFSWYLPSEGTQLCGGKQLGKIPTRFQALKLRT